MGCHPGGGRILKQVLSISMKDKEGQVKGFKESGYFFPPPFLPLLKMRLNQEGKKKKEEKKKANPAQQKARGGVMRSNFYRWFMTLCMIHTPITSYQILLQ